MTTTAARHAPYTDATGPAAENAPARRAPDPRLIMLAVTALGGAYVLWHLGRGWIPHDEGALAHNAQRILYGELPHRDYDEIYTGGLAFLDAAALTLLGPTLWSIRVVLFALFLAWVPAVQYIGSRFVKPLAAAAVTLLAVVWSLPNYPAGMPSWYNLFLATLGVAALFRHLETGRRRWLMAAGAIGALSVLVKIVGLYYVAGAFLYFVYRVHARSRAAAGPQPALGAGYAAFVTAGLLLFVAALVGLVRHQLYDTEVVHYVVPGTLVALWLASNEWTAPAGPGRARFLELAGLVLPFLAGFAVPIALFLLPYATSGSIGTVMYGVFELPMRRFGQVVIPAPPLWTMLAVVPLALLAVAARRGRTPVQRWHVVAAAVVVALLVAVTGPFVFGYRIVWYVARSLPPVLVLAGVAMLARERDAQAAASPQRQRTVLLLAVLALCNLVQFPFAAPIYYCFIAPVVALAALALWTHVRPAAPTSAIPGAVLAFFLAFAVFRVNTSTVYGMGSLYAPYWKTAPLPLARGGIDVRASDAFKYGVLVPELQRRARGGYTWVSPDCPELYFLSGLKNPTRTMFEIFDNFDERRNDRILAALESHGVTAIVLNGTPPHSPPLDGALVERLQERYPYAANVYNFQLRWR